MKDQTSIKPLFNMQLVYRCTEIYFSLPQLVSEYFTAVNKANLTWGLVQEDFFPYNTNKTFWFFQGWDYDQGEGWWTGI